MAVKFFGHVLSLQIYKKMSFIGGKATYEPWVKKVPLLFILYSCISRQIAVLYQRKQEGML